MMTSAVALALALPLWEGREELGAGDANVAFYRSLLAEADDDVRCGLVASADALATRAEIGRRLLASLDMASEPRSLASQGRWPRRLAGLAIVLVLPSVALASYAEVGAPGRPDMPIASRRTEGDAQVAAAIPDIGSLIAADPDDGRRSQLAAPIDLRMGRFQDAARAYGTALRLLGENAQERASLGQALAMAAGGVVTAEARAAFERALIDDPKQPIARFFQAVAIEQDGDKDRARQLWESLEADTPVGTPLMAAIGQRLDRLSGKAQAEKQATQAGRIADSIAALPPLPRSDAIRGEVEGFAERLSQNGHDLQGWMQLIRSYAMLGEPEKAEAAAASARAQLAGLPEAPARIDDLVRQLGLKE